MRASNFTDKKNKHDSSLKTKSALKQISGKKLEECTVERDDEVRFHGSRTHRHYSEFGADPVIDSKVNEDLGFWEKRQTPMDL